MYGFDHRKSRPSTCRLLDMLDNGEIDPLAVAEMALGWMSEADVHQMMLANDIVETEDDEDDGQPDEAQEWADFDPDC